MIDRKNKVPAVPEAHMRHYYQRIYNAKPSPEIARTRPRRPPSANVSSASGSVQRRRFSSTPPSNESRLFQPKQRQRPNSSTVHRTGNPAYDNNGYGQYRPQALSRQQSQSTQDLYSRMPPRNEPGDYWTQRYLEHELGNELPSEDDDGYQRYSPVLRKETMKAPVKTLRASLTELNHRRTASDAVNHGSGDAANTGQMSNKIDDFLSAINKCEADMRDEFEFKLRRMEFATQRRRGSKTTGSMGWINRSSSQTSLFSNMNAMNMIMAPDSSRKTSVLTGGNSSSIPATVHENRRVVRRKPGQSRPSSRSLSAATKLYGGEKGSPTGTMIVASTRGRSQSPLISKARVARRPPQQAKVMTKTRPQSSSKRGSSPASVRPSTAKQIPEYPLPDTSNISSRLRKDRNYQPPRRKPRNNKKRGGNNRSHDEDNEYEDDFEDDDNGDREDEENEEDDEERRTMLMTKRWLDDQAARGMVRHRNRGKESAHEKESSKDSAYGYSGGESRLQTREPTPDTILLQQQQMWQLQNQKKLLRQKQQLRAQQNNNNNPMRVQHNSASETDQKSKLYVRLVNDVTGEILQRGVFTDRAVREVLEAHAREHEGVSRREVEVLMATLKKELGLSSTGPKLSTATMRSAKSEPSLKDLLFTSEDHAKVKRGSQRRLLGATGRGNTKDSYDTLDELSDIELTNILHDVDLDDSAVDELLDTIKYKVDYPVASRPNRLDLPPSAAAGASPSSMDSPGNLKLFDSLNITDLNISFNTSAQGQLAKEKRKEKREQLIKSFAKQHPERPSSGKAVKKASAPPTQALKKQLLPKTSVAGGLHRRNDSSSSNPDVKITVPPPPPTKRKERVPQPESPSMSSETPRSSSLYHPESDEEEAVARKPPRSMNKDNSDISEDCDNNNVEEEEDYTSISEDEVGEEIESET